MGVNPSLLTHMRAQAACAVSTCTKGQCPTTLIWLGLGREQDPAIKVPCDQIRMWLYLAPKADQVLISKAWWRMKIDFFTSSMPWSKVKGPLGATIGTLDSIGWNPITPHKWLDSHGDVWKYMEGACHTQMIREMKEQIEVRLWTRAAQHRNGNGLQNGADLP